uniref:Uncharacterized protein n=1 Tax=Melopsittacus undulatus TaxID=13146 RepID=A0A8V5FL64_MELUD
MGAEHLCVQRYTDSVWDLITTSLRVIPQLSNQKEQFLQTGAGSARLEPLLSRGGEHSAHSTGTMLQGSTSTGLCWLPNTRFRTLSTFGGGQKPFLCHPLLPRVCVTPSCPGSVSPLLPQVCVTPPAPGLCHPSCPGVCVTPPAPGLCHPSCPGSVSPLLPRVCVTLSCPGSVSPPPAPGLCHPLLPRGCVTLSCPGAVSPLLPRVCVTPPVPGSVSPLLSRGLCHPSCPGAVSPLLSRGLCHPSCPGVCVTPPAPGLCHPSCPGVCVTPPAPVLCHPSCPGVCVTPPAPGLCHPSCPGVCVTPPAPVLCHPSCPGSVSPLLPAHHLQWIRDYFKHISPGSAASHPFPWGRALCAAAGALQPPVGPARVRMRRRQSQDCPPSDAQAAGGPGPSTSRQSHTIPAWFGLEGTLKLLQLQPLQQQGYLPLPGQHSIPKTRIGFLALPQNPGFTQQHFSAWKPPAGIRVPLLLYPHQPTPQATGQTDHPAGLCPMANETSMAPSKERAHIHPMAPKPCVPQDGKTLPHSSPALAAPQTSLVPFPV